MRVWHRSFHFWDSPGQVDTGGQEQTKLARATELTSRAHLTECWRGGSKQSPPRQRQYAVPLLCLDLCCFASVAQRQLH